MIYPFVWGYYGMGFPFIVRWNDKISLRISKAAFFALKPPSALRCVPPDSATVGSFGGIFTGTRITKA
jgi:hypothetical protein